MLIKYCHISFMTFFSLCCHLPQFPIVANDNPKIKDFFQNKNHSNVIRVNVELNKNVKTVSI